MASLTHIPERTCIVCRKKNAKATFFRLYKLEDGSFGADIEQTLEGRGMYVCKTDSCLSQLLVGTGKNKKGFKQVSVAAETVTMLKEKLS